MEMQTRTTITKTITLTPTEVEGSLETSTREGKFMNFTPPEEASINATMLPNGGAQVIVTYSENDTNIGQ